MTSQVQKSEDNEIDDFVIVPSTFLTPQWQAQALNNPPKESVNIQNMGQIFANLAQRCGVICNAQWNTAVSN